MTIRGRPEFVGFSRPVSITDSQQFLAVGLTIFPILLFHISRMIGDGPLGFLSLIDSGEF